MRRSVSSVVIAVATLIAGCGSDPVRQSATYPAVGVIETRGVGEWLINSSSGYLVPDIRFEQDVNVGSHRIAKGKYDYEDENSKGIWFSGHADSFYMRKADGQICVEETKQCATSKYTLEKRLSDESEDSFQQTLLYNGRIGDRITLGYREFSNDLAREAFSNNVDYDLSESMVVGYKGARIEVIEATNTQITYRLLSGFSK